MIINVLNRDLVIVDIIDDAKSIIWTKRFWECGDFELYMIANEKNLNKVTQGYFLSRDDDSTVMIIDKIEIKTDIDNGNFITVTGRSAESLLERRCHMSNRQNVSMEGNYPAIISYLALSVLCNNEIFHINNNYENNENWFCDPTRNIPCVLWLYSAIWDKLNEEYGGAGQWTTIDQTSLVNDGTWLKTMENTAKLYGFGFELRKHIAGSTYLVLDAIISKNRSIHQTENPQIIFSKEYDNLISSNYYNDKTNYKNCAFVYGEGEGSDRICKRIWRNPSNKPSGLDLYEVFIDARDISSTRESKTLNHDEYGELLDIRAKEKFIEYKTVEAFDGEIQADMQWKYKQDYFIGDIVTMQNEYGIEKDVRITAVTECEDDTGYFYIPIFENLEV